MKRSIVGVMLAASLLLAPVAYADPPTVSIGVSLSTHIQLGANLLPINSLIPQPAATATASPTAALIQSLIVEVNALEAQIAALTANSSPASNSTAATASTPTPTTAGGLPTATSCTPFSLSRSLSLGITGSDVDSLQQFLESEGYLHVASTGYFGTLTQAAVEAFQSANGIQPVGSVGPITRANISALTDACQNEIMISQAAPASSATVATSTQSAATSSATSIPLPLPIVSLTYGGGGEGEGSVPPASCNISALPVSVQNGASTTLSWSSSLASSASLSTFGSVQTTGSQSVVPVSDPTYTLSVSGAGGSGICRVAVDVAPGISSVASTTITGSSATITWTTDKPADTQLAYGITSAYGATTSLDTTLTTSHSVTITGLSESTAYHFQLHSSDSSGNSSYSSDYSLTTAPPLPALPFAPGAKVSAIGDSIFAFNDGFDTLGIDSYAYGEINWAWAVDPRFNFDNWYDPSDPSGRSFSGADNGVNGDHLVGPGTGATPGILNRLPTVLSHDPNILIFVGGSNTINSGDTGGSDAAYVESEIDAALTEAREAGVWVILTTIRPRGDWPAGDPRYQELNDVNTWIREQAGRDGVFAIWDPNSVYLDSNGNQVTSLFQSDLVHQNQYGAQLASASLDTILDSMISSGSTFDQNPLDNNFLGTTTNMTGTAGTKSNASSTGSVATGYALAIGRNDSTVAASKIVVSGTTEKQVLTITPIGGTASAFGEMTLTFPQVFATGNFVAGDWLQAGCYVQVGNTGSMSMIRLMMNIDQSSTVRATTYAMDAFSPDFTRTTEPNIGYWLVTPPIQAPTSTSFDRAKALLDMFFPSTATDTPVVTASSCFVRKVSDPRPAWGF